MACGRHGHPLSFETLQLNPWLSLEPFELHLNALATNFAFGQPKHGGNPAIELKARDPDMVRVGHLHFHLKVDADAVWRLLRGKPVRISLGDTASTRRAAAAAAALRA